MGAGRERTSAITNHSRRSKAKPWAPLLLVQPKNPDHPRILFPLCQTTSPSHAMNNEWTPTLYLSGRDSCKPSTPAVALARRHCFDMSICPRVSRCRANQSTEIEPLVPHLKQMWPRPAMLAHPIVPCSKTAGSRPRALRGKTQKTRSQNPVETGHAVALPWDYNEVSASRA